MLDKEVMAALSKPFPPEKVRLKIQAKLKSDSTKAIIVAYIDARDVMDRLDEVGVDWSDFYHGVTLGDKTGVECQLTINEVTRSDIGDPESDGMDTSLKSAYSDAFKRAAVKFGVGRFLYSLPKMYAKVDGNRIDEKELPVLYKKLRAHLESVALGKPIEEEPETKKERVFSINALEAVISFNSVDENTGEIGQLATNHEEAKAILDLSVLPENVSPKTVMSWLKHFVDDKSGQAVVAANIANEAYLKAKNGGKS